MRALRGSSHLLALRFEILRYYVAIISLAAFQKYIQYTSTFRILQRYIIGINPSRFVLTNSRTLLKFIVHRVLTMLLPFHNLDFQIFNVWPRKQIFFNLRFSILKSSILKQCCNFSSFERSKIYHDPRVLVSKSKHIFIARSMNTHANSPQNKGDSSNFLITKTKKSIEEI